MQRPPKPKPGALVGKRAESHLNRLQQGHLSTLSDVEVRDLDNYVGISYRTINSALRADRELGSVSARRVENIDSAIAKSAPLDEDVTLWRGVGSYRSVFGEGDLDALVGRTFSDQGFASTTTRRSVADGSTGVGAAKGKNAALLKIRAPQGQQGAWINGLAQPAGRRDLPGLTSAMAKREGEFILPRGTRYRVVSVKKGGFPEIEVEIVP